MSTKHIFEAEHLVERSLRGVVATNPNLHCHGPSKVVYDASWSPVASQGSSPIALIAGGGAGHEPAFAGYVGQGMLTAAISGDIFASPSTRQICTCLDLLLLSSSSSAEDSNGNDGRSKKAIFVVLQYSGDALNFGLAREKARAAGWEVEVVLVGDDVSIGRAQGGRVGRRGLAAQVFVIKAMGALLARTEKTEREREIVGSVGALAEFGRGVAEYAGTMGVSLDHCHLPGSGRSSSSGWNSLGAEQVGLGVGIHNEPGLRLETYGSQEPGALINKLLNFILNKDDADRAFLAYESADKFVLVINNLGGISTLELNAVVHETVVQLKEGWKIAPTRVFAGTYLSSLNAPGFSISLIDLDKIQSKTGVDVLTLLEDPTQAVGWTGSRSYLADAPRNVLTAEELSRQLSNLKGGITQTSSKTASPSSQKQERIISMDAKQVQNMLASAASSLIAAEPEITRLDTLQGDGDCGTTLRSLAHAVQSALKADEIPLGDAQGVIAAVGGIVEGSMGGTSGALYALFFSALAVSLQRQRRQEGGGGENTATSNKMLWAQSTLEALESLSQFTPARPGDRTLIDALDPFVRTLATSSFEDAARASREGAEGTSGMVARLGRAAYVGENDAEGQEGQGKGEKKGERLPDPGAVGVAALLEGLLAGSKM
ncbi:unnamed protein product [Tilletia controversa]|nr:unnamed protein product [Tilletia controversa]